MDINDISGGERTVEVKTPDGTGIGLFVTIVSIDDPTMSQTKRRFQDNALKANARGKNLKAEEIDENRNFQAFKAMRGWKWEGDANWKGEKPDFNQRNVLEVLSAKTWIRDFIESEISDIPAFFKNSNPI